MDKRSFEQIRECLSKNQKIGIAVGKNPGIDEMGGVLALYLSLIIDGKNVTVACPSDVLVEHSSLVGIDKVEKSFEDATGDMIVSFPYREGEIEKISYTLEDGFLNIVVKAEEQGLSFSERDVIFRRSNGYPGLLFVIGTPRLSDLDKLYDPHALRDTTVINIDNKRDNQGFGDIVLIPLASSSVSETISELLLDLDLPMDIDIAQNLMIGIESGTNNFQDAKTSPEAFEMAALLMKRGAGRREINPRRQPAAFEEISSIFSPKDVDENNPVDDKKDLPFTRQVKRDITARQRKNPPDDWLTPKIYKGSTNI